MGARADTRSRGSDEEAEKVEVKKVHNDKKQNLGNKEYFFMIYNNLHASIK